MTLLWLRVRRRRPIDDELGAHLLLLITTALNPPAAAAIYICVTDLLKQSRKTNVLEDSPVPAVIINVGVDHRSSKEPLLGISSWT